MAKKINKTGGQFFGKSHANGGIPLTVKDSGQNIEVEGNEPLITSEALKDKKIKKRTGKNIEILDQINKKVGAKGMNEPASEVYSGDAIVCKRSANDNKKRTYIGTDKQIVSAINESNGCRKIEGGAKAIEPDGKVFQYKKGGKISKEEEEAIRKQRWVKKRERIQELANNIHRLRLNLTNDLKSDNEKIFLTALVVSIMDKTGERVGNEDSASNGHFGVTGFRKKHVKIDGNKVTLDYIGKSGVEHDTSFSDEKIAKNLKKAIDNSRGYFVFTTSQGFRIKADRINRYLTDFKVTAKDIRGYTANKLIIEKLKNVEVEENENKRKRQFLKILKTVSEKIGHGRATLRKHYMIPELETTFMEKGEIIDIKDLGYYDEGGEVKSGMNKKLVKPTKNNKPVSAIKEKYTIDEVEKEIGRELHWWHDDIIDINGTKYKKSFLQSSYYRL